MSVVETLLSRTLHKNSNFAEYLEHTISCTTIQKFWNSSFHSKFCKNEEHMLQVSYYILFVRCTCICIVCFLIIFHPFKNSSSCLALSHSPSPSSLDPSQREKPSDKVGVHIMFYLSVVKIALYLLSFNSSAVLFSPLSLCVAFWIELVLLARL